MDNASLDQADGGEQLSSDTETDTPLTEEEERELADLVELVEQSRRAAALRAAREAAASPPPTAPTPASARIDYRRQRGRGRFGNIVTELLHVNKAPMEIAVFLAVDVRSVLLVRDRYVAECLQRDERPSDSALLSIRMTAGWSADRRWEHLRKHGYDSAALRRLRKRKGR